MDKNTINKLFMAIMKKQAIFKVISLSTADGFTVCTAVKDSDSMDQDRLSAVSSSLASLSHAAAKQLMNAKMSNTIIETDKGEDMLIVKTRYEDKDAVLCVISEGGENLGKTRYYAVKLALQIAG
ncbi:roadblock/LC7 domain-containing protein [Marinicella sp. W31]|uniref:roadblock/LC7 domain-containing protein n=1 Tax=Marinicella sp. W31 TaxID=3023713 RepID=UPI00375739D3